MKDLKKMIQSRLEQSLETFYPIKDREQASKQKNRLSIQAHMFPIGGDHLYDVDNLKKELLNLI